MTSSLNGYLRNNLSRDLGWGLESQSQESIPSDHSNLWRRRRLSRTTSGSKCLATGLTMAESYSV